jgi:hypothetical protein
MAFFRIYSHFIMFQFNSIHTVFKTVYRVVSVLMISFVNRQSLYYLLLLAVETAATHSSNISSSNHILHAYITSELSIL